MNRTVALAATTLLLLAGACSKQTKTTLPQEQAASGTEHRAPSEQPAESAFGRAWDSIETGAAATAQAGVWVVDKTADGAIQVYRSTERVAGRPGREISDAAVTADVKTRLAADPDVSAMAVDVDTNDHVVTLSGEVPSSHAASEAVRTTLDTRGVDRVISRLRWPGMR